MSTIILDANAVAYNVSHEMPEIKIPTTTRFKIDGYDEYATLTSNGELLRVAVGSEVSLTMADGSTIIATAIKEAE